MSFNSEHLGDRIAASPVECKPDYEKQAANLKARLLTAESLENSIFDFLEKNNGHRFNKITSLAELLGGLSIIKREQAARYEELRVRMENNQ